MATSETVWGIDVGRCALKAVKLRAVEDGKAELIACDYIEHAKILSQPDADRRALVASALEKFLSRNDITKDQIVIGVPGQQTLARFTKLPPVAPKKVPDIVRYEAEQQIPFDMDEVIWDFQVFQRQDLPDVEVGIFAMKRELIREHLLHFEQASIEPIAVQTGPLAMYNAMHADGRLGENATILLDIGAENTDLVIATADTFWSRTISIGGNSFTDALVKSFKLSFNRAENLKRTAATSKYGRQVFQALRPIFADLVQELQRSIGFYASTHRDAEIDKVIGMGNAFKLPGLQKYLQQNLGMDVETIDGFARIDIASAAKRDEFKDQILSFPVATGLALQGLDIGKINCSLLPVEIAKQLVWQKKRVPFLAAAACLLVAGGLVWFRQYTDMQALAANAEGADTVNVSDVAQASSIIDRGPDNLSYRARSKQVLLAAQKLSNELNTLSSQGEVELKQSQDLVNLQRQKALLPQVYATIREALPQNHPALAGAATYDELREAASAVPRREREQVFIKRLRISYEEDVHEVLLTNLTEVDDVILEIETIVPGFLVELDVVSPNAGGIEFIAKSFMQRLREVGRRPGRGFFFDRVYLAQSGKYTPVEHDERRGTTYTTGRDVPAMTSKGGAGGKGMAMGGKGGGPIGVTEPSAPSAPSARDLSATEVAMIDPVTEESMSNDWEFKIYLDVILEDLPESALPEEEVDEEETED